MFKVKEGINLNSVTLTNPTGTALVVSGGELVSSATLASGIYNIKVIAASGADRSLIIAGVNGVSNGFTVNYTHATTSLAYSFLGSGPSSFSVTPAATFGNTVALFGASSQMYMGSSGTAGQYGIVAWNDTTKCLEITGTQGQGVALRVEDQTVTVPGITVLGNGTSTALTLTVDSTNANGPYISFRRSNSGFGSIGSASQLVSGGANDTLAIRSDGANLDFGISSALVGRFTSAGFTVNGAFYATSKSFKIAHPTKEGKQLVYGSLEGPENGVYVRGKATSNSIELPEYWTKLVDQDSITVQLTPIGPNQKPYVTEVVGNTVYLANETGNQVNCYFLVQAERIDVPKLEVEIDG